MKIKLILSTMNGMQQLDADVDDKDCVEEICKWCKEKVLVPKSNGVSYDCNKDLGWGEGHDVKIVTSGITDWRGFGGSSK